MIKDVLEADDGRNYREADRLQWLELKKERDMSGPDEFNIIYPNNENHSKLLFDFINTNKIGTDIPQAQSGIRYIEVNSNSNGPATGATAEQKYPNITPWNITPWNKDKIRYIEVSSNSN